MRRLIMKGGLAVWGVHTAVHDLLWRMFRDSQYCAPNTKGLWHHPKYKIDLCKHVSLRDQCFIVVVVASAMAFTIPRH